MSPIVVDASTVASAIFRERHTAAAKAALVGAELHAPDFIYAEVANVIWKRHHRGELAQTQALDLLKGVRRLPLRITPCETLIEEALTIAMQTHRAAYDSIYIALAVKIKAVVMTTDQRLVNGLSGGPFASYVQWLGQGI